MVVLSRKKPHSLTVVFNFLLLFAQMVEVESGGTMELTMNSFNNPTEHLYDGSCCDALCIGQCDDIFHFSMDLSPGNPDDPKSSFYWSKVTGTFQDQNNVVFNNDMRGVNNPIVWAFDSWPGTVLFKVYIEDDDHPYTANDYLDGMIQRLTLTPSRSKSLATSTAISIYGIRPRDKTVLSMTYKLYCDDNFYGPKCSVYCLAQDSNSTGHYTCDQDTGALICRTGWEDVSNNCRTFSDDCFNKNCHNGQCIDGVRSFSCSCNGGFTEKTRILPGNRINMAKNHSWKFLLQLFQCTSVLLTLKLSSGGVSASGALELRLISFRNPSGHGRGGSVCDDWWAGECDTRFTFSLGPTGGSSSYLYYQTNNYDDENDVYFVIGNNEGVDNPMIYRFQAWPDQVIFSIEVVDEDVKYDDPIDDLVQSFSDLIPSKSRTVATETSITIVGQRAQDKTALSLSYLLYCDADFYGKSCSVYCVPQDSNTTGHYTCDQETGRKICRSGWKNEVSNCLTLADDCVANLCLNGGTCYADRRCSCPPRFTGSKCEYTACDVEHPCLNGGTCTGNGICRCSGNYTGDLCQGRRCDLNTGLCQNGGECVNGICVCSAPFWGDNCEKESCSEGTCQNGGNCSNTVDDPGFQCKCPSVFTGLNCQTTVTPVQPSSGPESHSTSAISPMALGLIVLGIVLFVAFVVLVIFFLLRRRQQRTTADANRRSYRNNSTETTSTTTLPTEQSSSNSVTRSTNANEISSNTSIVNSIRKTKKNNNIQNENIYNDCNKY